MPRFNLRAMVITGSPDISVLQLSVVFDISGLAPVVNITNLSQGSNLAGCTWWFNLTSPSGTPIHQGSLSQPDVTGAWATFAMTDQWPRPMNQIEWSGAPYSLSVTVQDSHGNQFTDSSYTAAIQRPNGNISTSKNFYGIGNTNVQVICQQAAVYFEDITNTSYWGLSGTRLSSNLRVIYPLDLTYSIPTPFTAALNSPVLVPITYSAKGYQFLAQSFYQYQLSPFVALNIQYQNLQSFDVLCNIDLSPLICEVTNLIDSIENGSCADVQEATRKLTLINPKFALAVMGVMQPLTGVDVPSLVQDIIDIGGFSCDCCNAPTGIIPTTASIIDGYSFSVNPVCGDITGTVTMNNNNITFNLQDKSYVFNLNAAIPTTAFTITPSTSGCVKTYTLNVSMVQFGTDLANTILGNSGLVNLWNTIFSSSNNTQLVVDGKCIFTSSATYNYGFTLAGVPGNTTFALVTGIQKSSVIQGLNFSLNLTNLAAFQAYLNSLNIGVFTVTNPSGNNVLVSSTANPNVLSQLTYSISSTNFIASLTSTASGYAPISANQVVQNIINYLCGITDAQMVTSAPYTISYVDVTGTIQQATIPAGTSLSAFISDLLTYGNETITNIGKSSSITCAALTEIFTPTPSPITGADFVYGTAGGGVCSQINYMDLFTYLLTTGQTNAAVKEAFCNFVESCGAGLVCAPYNYFNAIVTTYNSTCVQIVGIEATLS